MSNEYEVIAEGYLYNLRNGKLKEYRGEVLHKEKYEDSYGRYISPEVNYFMVHDEHNRIVKLKFQIENHEELIESLRKETEES